MNFDKKYNEIKNVVKEDFDFLEKELIELFAEDTPMNEQLRLFLTAPSKRLRPLIGFLFLKNIFGEISKSQREILVAVELIHNATLIHDDVIDNSTKRRNIETINSKFDNDLAVVAGDLLLSLALEMVLNTNSIDVLKVFTNDLKSTCLGEINQYFSKFKVPTIEQYIEKSKEKTALLFQTGVLGGLLLSKEKNNADLKQAAIDFTQNFGIAFQIRDDLINITAADDLKPYLNDFKSGIYTAPIIFAYQENSKILEELEDEKLSHIIHSTCGIEKTRALMDNYLDKVILAINNFKDTPYKRAIIELIALLKERV